MTLDELKNGRRATITGIDGQDPLAQRLMALGLLEGTDVEVNRRALGGDPLEISIWGSTLSLRREEARRITVEQHDG